MASENAGTEVFGGFWVRAAAAVIDGLLILVITWPILLSVYGSAYFAADSAFIQGPLDFLLSYVFPAIATILFWIYKGATPGKMSIGARIVDAQSGGQPTNGQLVGRYFAYFLSLIPLGLGFLWVAWDGRKQGWHDKLAGTVVVRKRSQPQTPQFDRVPT